MDAKAVEPFKVERWKLADLLANPRNVRDHPPEQIAQLRTSIREFGFTIPLLVRPDGLVIAGNGRLEAAIAEGLDDVPVVVAHGWTETQCRAYAIIDNKVALNANWNAELLREELGALLKIDLPLAGLLGFSEAEMRALDLGDLIGGPNSGSDPDEQPRVPAQPVTRPGDLWCMAQHRLVCGDSTDAASIARLMDGKRAALVFTSPPYADQRDYTTGGIGNWEQMMRGVFPLALPTTENAQALVNLGVVHRDNEWQPYWQGWLDWMHSEQGWRRFGLYVWDQGWGLPGDWAGRLAPSFELVFHFNRKSRKPNKIIACKNPGDHTHENAQSGFRKKDGAVADWTHSGQGIQETRIPDNVIRINRQVGGIAGHPAPFPVALPEFVMCSFSNARDVVYEPFAGSGSSILAAQRCGRRSMASELAPEYVDVAVQRWRKLFPDEPVTLDGSGRTFEAVAAERGIELPSAAPSQ